MSSHLTEFSCTTCAVQHCQKRNSSYPSFCPTTTKLEDGELDELNIIYAGDEIDGKMARTAARIEGEFYMKKTRVEETVIFIKRMGFKKVGIATCAGLILLADYFRTLPVKVKRNAYGRQSASFHVDSEFSGVGSIPMTFIRAPCIELAENGVEVKSRVDGRITGVQFGKQIGIAFHPELDSDTKLLSYWLSIK